MASIGVLRAGALENQHGRGLPRRGGLLIFEFILWIINFIEVNFGEA
jgi:hypothetical protein